MQYRKFGKLDWEISVLGFGAMRLPIKNNDYSQIDEIEATRMLHYAIDNGVNYIDTAWMYHNGDSERLLGSALKNGYRKKIKLATKLHYHAVESPKDFDKILHEQLRRLQTDYIDMYLLHGLFQEGWCKLRDWDILNWAEKAIAQGYIKHLGFSFHDSFTIFKEILNAYDNWAMCQIQYNFLDEDVQAGTKGIKLAADKELAIVIMEPLRGGYIVNPAEKIRKIWDQYNKNPVQVALKWLWSKPEISVVLSGMSSMEQVKENLKYASSSDYNILSKNDCELINSVKNKYIELKNIPCTKCQYCIPCPNGVDIPRNFELYNNDNRDLSKALYYWMAEDKRANSCIMCGECETKCPQKIQISKIMPELHNELWNPDYNNWAHEWRIKEK